MLVFSYNTLNIHGLDNVTLLRLNSNHLLNCIDSDNQLLNRGVQRVFITFQSYNIDGLISKNKNNNNKRS